jgi:hypothetical protein
MNHRSSAPASARQITITVLATGLIFGLLGCAPTTSQPGSRPGVQATKTNANADNINFQSFINARNFKTVVVNEIGPFSEDVRIRQGSGQEWIVKLNKPGKRLTLGVISSRGSIDFLLHGARLTSNAPAHADTSTDELKKLEFRNPAEGTYYVYALNRTRTAQDYTLVISLE